MLLVFQLFLLGQSLVSPTLLTLFLFRDANDAEVRYIMQPFARNLRLAFSAIWSIVLNPEVGFQDPLYEHGFHVIPSAIVILLLI